MEGDTDESGSEDMTGEGWRSVFSPSSLSNFLSHCCFAALLVRLAGGGFEENGEGAVAGSGSAGVGAKGSGDSMGWDCNGRQGSRGEAIGGAWVQMGGACGCGDSCGQAAFIAAALPEATAVTARAKWWQKMDTPWLPPRC